MAFGKLKFACDALKTKVLTAGGTFRVVCLQVLQADAVALAGDEEAVVEVEGVGVRQEDVGDLPVAVEEHAVRLL